jgi:hypothetical protein
MSTRMHSGELNASRRIESKRYSRGWAAQHLHVEADPASKAAFRQHPIHRLLNDALRDALLQVLEGLDGV